ncbi:MAG: hypothetical protein Q4E01_02815 [Actinomycetaceae bacterium]|nr:hypothetical protein [Actinomycetaceae bacterium]
MQLREGTAIFVRGNGDVQVGLGKKSAVVTGLDAAEQSYLQSLKFRSSNCATEARARKRNIPKSRIDAIRSLLTKKELTQLGLETESTPDSQRLMRRDGTTNALARREDVRLDIAVFSCGDPTQFLKVKPFVSALATSLRGASITRVGLKYHGDDMGGSSRTALHEAVGLGKPMGSEPHFVVALFTRASSSSLIHVWQEAGIPVLSVVFNEDSVQVGPVERAGSSPCLECIDRNLRDLEPEWPALQIQCRNQPFPSLSSDLMRTAAMMTARLVANEVDGYGLPAGEVRFVDENFLFDRFRWPAHPNCSCSGLPASVQTAEATVQA